MRQSFRQIDEVPAGWTVSGVKSGNVLTPEHDAVISGGGLTFQDGSDPVGACYPTFDLGPGKNAIEMITRFTLGPGSTDSGGPIMLMTEQERASALPGAPQGRLHLAATPVRTLLSVIDQALTPHIFAVWGVFYPERLICDGETEYKLKASIDPVTNIITVTPPAGPPYRYGPYSRFTSLGGRYMCWESIRNVVTDTKAYILEVEGSDTPISDKVPVMS